MYGKTDRVHIRNLFDVSSSYERKTSEILLTFRGGVSDKDYLNTREAVIHIGIWFLPYIVRALKDVYKQVRKELDDFVASVSSGITEF